MCVCVCVLFWFSEEQRQESYGVVIRDLKEFKVKRKQIRQEQRKEQNRMSMSTKALCKKLYPPDPWPQIDLVS